MKKNVIVFGTALTLVVVLTVLALSGTFSKDSHADGKGDGTSMALWIRRVLKPEGDFLGAIVNGGEDRAEVTSVRENDGTSEVHAHATGTGVCSSCGGLGSCKYCNGLGECPYCFGEGSQWCDSCCGGGACSSCDGFGYIDNYQVGKGYVQIRCSRCSGTGNCTRCRGMGSITCGYCSGSGSCAVCHGTAVCTICGGSGRT